MQYIVNGNLNHNGTDYKTGDTVELSPEEAEGLLRIGRVTLVEETKPAEEAPVSEPPLVEPPVASDSEITEPTVPQPQEPETPPVEPPTLEAPRGVKNQGVQPTPEQIEQDLGGSESGSDESEPNIQLS